MCWVYLILALKLTFRVKGEIELDGCSISNFWNMGASVADVGFCIASVGDVSLSFSRVLCAAFGVFSFKSASQFREAKLCVLHFSPFFSGHFFCCYLELKMPEVSECGQTVPIEY